MTENKLREILIEFFESKKEENCKYIGIEFEHFIINNQTMESYDYQNGVNKIVKKLIEAGWNSNGDYDTNQVLGLKKDGHIITLEPGGQLEISLDVCDNVTKIESKYLKILNEIKKCLAEDQSIASIGYHPKSKIDDLDILPKKRYDTMYKYFKEKGKYAHNMMKGTASTQVTIDYKSESDFIKKFKVANFLSPFIYRIFDSSPIFEGDLYKEENLRIDIWDNTDNDRSGIVDGSLSKNEFGFNEYIDYVLDTPPIFLKQNNEYTFTGDTKLKELIINRDLNLDNLKYILGMVFPDVRLKGYIELRMADALPYPYNLAVPALIKGIFYNELNLKKYFQLSKGFIDRDIKELKDILKTNLDFVYKGININEFVFQILDDAKKGLDADEIKYIDRIIDILNNHISMSKYLKKLYLNDKNEFIKFISGGE